MKAMNSESSVIGTVIRESISTGTYISLLVEAQRTTCAGFPSKADLNRWRRVISPTMGYYKTAVEIRIAKKTEVYQWRTTFMESTLNNFEPIATIALQSIRNSRWPSANYNNCAICMNASRGIAVYDTTL